MRALTLVLAFAVSAPALAQYAGPAVEACRAYAKRELAREGMNAADVVIESDAELLLDRYARKAGSQLVHSVLTGNGAVVLPGAPASELAFICLLADEKRPLFFAWLPRRNPSALAQCTRDKGLRDDPSQCLRTLLTVAEDDLTQLYAYAFQSARERDHGSGAEKHTDAFRKSNDHWKEYRDAECARRRDAAPEGVAPETMELACRVELTRRRTLDMGRR